MAKDIQDAYSYVFEPELLEELQEIGIEHDFKEGEQLIEIGQYIKTMPLLLHGAIKVMREDPDEGELLLYFVERGDTCAMTLTCCMGNAKSDIRAIAETDGTVLMIPIKKMEEWMTKYHSWRSFVINSYNNRLKEMLVAIDNLAFMKMEDRILNYLLEKSKLTDTTTLNTTHQDIANDLNTSRVVVSRILKKMENENQIKLNRKSIDLIL